MKVNHKDQKEGEGDRIHDNILIEWSRGGRNLAYLITSATAGWVCSSEIMSGDQTGLAEQSDDTCRTMDELQSKVTAGD